MNMVAKDMPKAPPRQRAWIAIREHKDEFTVEKIAAIAEMKIDATRDFLTGLNKANFIEITRREAKPLSVGGNTKVVYYKLINDVGYHAPSVNRKGQIAEPRGVNRAMWNTLRICKAAVTPTALAGFPRKLARIIKSCISISDFRWLCPCN